MNKLKRAFTLIELLVVISIIALLMAILLPTLNRAREVGRRAVCAATLRSWGQASHTHAEDYKGLFPMAFAMQSGYRYPSAIQIGFFPTASTPVDWRSFGTSEATWASYGIRRSQSMRCPSSQSGFTPGYYFDQGLYADWGNYTWIHYSYVGGLTVNNSFPSVPSWGRYIPAVSTAERVAHSSRMLASDENFWYGPTDPGNPDILYRINHQGGRRNVIDFTNMLMADGSVIGLGSSHITGQIDSASPSFIHWTGLPWGFFYWGQ